MYRYKHLSSRSLATLFLLALITISAAQQNTDPPKNGFSPDNVPDPCKQTEFIDCSKCPCQELSSEFNAWMLAIAGLSSALSFLFLIFVVLIQQIRQKPGDLILGTIFGQIIFSITIIIEKIAFPIPHADLVQQSEADGACIAFGLIKTFSAALLNFYLLAFFAVYVLSKKNYIKTSRFKARYIHIAGVGITGLFSVVLLTWKAIGLNADGTCGMTSGPAILAPTVGYGVLTVFAAYLVYLTRKNLAGRESITEAPADFVKHYLFYLGIMCGLFLAGAVVAVISDIKTSPDEAVDNTMIHIFGFIQFTILNLSSIVLMVARLRDPLISVHIKDYLKEKLCCQTPEVDERKRSYDEEEMCLGTVNDDVHIDMHKRFISNSSLVQGPYGMFQSSSRDSFEQYKKTEMLSSVLASLAYFWKESHQNALLKSIDLKKDRSPKNAFGRKKSSKSFNVRNSTLMRIVPQVIREFDRRDKKLLYGTFTAYLPDLMQEIIDKDDLMLEIKDAWNFIPNYGNILSYGFNVDEYRKMFFLSSNGKYILQEISSQEKRTLLQALPDYVYHIKANPDSLLARIYGMFTFEAEDHISQVHMIVMKNIGEWGWPGIEKLYKLRGSHTNNERKKGEYSPFNEKDFEAYEGKLVLEMPLKDNIMNILNKDVVFLELNNFENYALQVSLVNKEKVSKEMVSSSVIIEVEEHGDVSPDLRLVKNREFLVRDYEEGFDVDSEDLTERTEMKETNIKTYVGIVDFWKESASKRSNLVWKTLRSLRPLKQETVNDAPVRYGKAFLKYVESIVE